MQCQDIGGNQRYRPAQRVSALDTKTVQTRIWTSHMPPMLNHLHRYVAVLADVCDL